MVPNGSVRVLQVACGFRKGVSGGVPSFVHSYVAAIDASDIAFDFLSLGYQCYEPYRMDLEDIGGTLYELGITETGAKRLYDITNKLSEFLQSNKYDIVHINTGSIPQMYHSVIAAKRANVRAIVAHSHNAIPVEGILRRVLYPKYVQGIQRNSDALYAVSKMAAESMFPKSIIREKAWTLVPDAIPANRFAFDKSMRSQIRSELYLNSKFVVGHVGRFNKQKNHAFVLKIFAEVCKRRDDAVLMLVGTGDMQDDVRKQAADLGLLDRVLFMGQRTDVNKLMQAMDVFVFPSLFEGLGIVAIEAQAAGLPVVMGDNMPEETNITDLANYLPISVGADVWASRVLDCADISRRVTTQEITDAGYDIHLAAASLAEFYRDLVR